MGEIQWWRVFFALMAAVHAMFAVESAHEVTAAGLTVAFGLLALMPGRSR